MKFFATRPSLLPLAILAFRALSSTGFATPPTITQQPQVTSFTLLHNFTNGNDGGNPTSSLIQGTDGRLYGTTQNGGASGNGNLFAVNPDGAGFTTLYSFTAGNDGGNPYSGLIQGTDGRLYGTTPFDGVNNFGTVFAVNSDGTGFTALYSFTAGNDGANPTSSLIQGTDGRLFGTTSATGVNGFGTVFGINPDGANFAALCSFSGINDGAYPSGGLIRGTDGRLYGTTPGSASIGNNSFGTVFAVNPDGTGFTTLYTFTNGNDGAQPFGGLIQGTDGRLYGTTAGIPGGPGGNGTVFAVNPDGTGFATLYSFTGGNDGGAPQSSLIQGTDGRLYGTVVFGGANNEGAVFALKPDGTNFITLYNFTGSNDGSFPEAGLIHGTDGRLYGMTQNGGPSNRGTLFAISSEVVPAGTNATFTVAATGTAPLSYQWEFKGVDIAGATNATFTLTNVAASNAGSYTVVVSNAEGSATSTAVTLALTSPGQPLTPVFAPPAGTYSAAQSVIISSVGANSIYYTTDGSTPTTASTLYTGAISLSTNTTLRAIGVNAGGSSPVMSGAYLFQIPPQITSQPAFSLLHSFTGGNDGGNPTSSLIQGTDGRLYGTAQSGGVNAAGLVFAVNPDGAGFTTLYSFNPNNGIDGEFPSAGLIQGADGRLYGTTQTGGTNNAGTVFAVNPDGSGFSTLYSFTGGNDGGSPQSSLVQGTDGRLYGATAEGGMNGLGTVFAINPQGTGFITLHSFTNGNSGGNVPSGLIQGTDGRLYGTTSGSGVATGQGTVFAIDPNGTGFITLYSFTGGNDGSNPLVSLIQGADGRLYGTAQAGGANGDGTVFAINPDGTGFATLYSFTNGDKSGGPSSDLIQGTDRRLYGTTFAGGMAGTVFAVNPDGTGFTSLYSFMGGSDGANPEAGLVQGTDGRLYGTTIQGANGFGTVFAISSPRAIAGTNVTYNVTASGAAPLSYQWQFNGVNINGAIGPTLTLTNVNLSNSGSYTVVVSNAYGSATSAPVALTVVLPPPPGAPVFAPAPGTYTTAQSGTITSANATSIYYTTDGSTPTIASTLYTGPVFIAATTKLSAIGINAAGSGPVTSGTYTILSPSTPVFDPAPGTYSTAQSVSIASAGATHIYYTTDGSTPTIASTLYTGPVSIAATAKLAAIGVDAAGSSPVASGTYNISISTTPPVIHSITATPDILAPPDNQLVQVTITVNATDASDPHPVSKIIAVSSNEAADHDVDWQITGPLSLNLRAERDHHGDGIIYTITVQTSDSFGLTATGTTQVIVPKDPDALEDRPHITADPGSQTVTEGTDVTFTVSVAPALPVTYQWRFNHHAIAGATGANLTLQHVTLANAGDYTVVVTNLNGSTTSNKADLKVLPHPPVITHGPQSQTVNSGSNVTFTVTATSDAPLTYQWKFNGRKIAGAINATLKLTRVKSSNAGAYSVVVSNAGGSATSTTATLTVTSPH
jgi:uncharacterized repeat protein (TIGR03803 family)